MPSHSGRYAEAHDNPQGPGDARPTATQIVKDEGLIGGLKGKTFLITGGTDGLGLETVKILAKTGAKVFFSARNPEKAKKVIQDIANDQDPELKGADIDWVKIDNTSLASVKEGAEEFQKKSDKLNVLITNAGIANIPFTRSADGFELQFAVNHLAHFYLLHLLTPLLLKSATDDFHSRFIAVASTAHGFGTVQIGNYNFEKPITEKIDPLIELPLEEGDHYNPMASYGQTKTANIWTANEVERRYGSQKLHGIAIHPGNILTAGWGNMDPRVSALFTEIMKDPKMALGMKSLEQGAATQVYAAISKDFEGKGRLYVEDCSIGKPLPDDEMIGSFGYRSWIFDDAGAEKLWADSLEMVGIKEA